ncbi:inhibitor of nuclear factor kappa-B kinase subunit alpha-like isoform X1 [Boleophthalmus pectinirostris]|uniref:inhibitor of nuclear factor kappa-B kinase subunit alpha-like isoform X1 n=2 Tax=Boleophthalmus pectinirostris TaxID=150288 RepID=UPI0024326944|nr:inhibitor of nuclear factor kappa-B kinase subunit alpha-like isoform X1 [Boleophthalmus pectinirostris]
MDRAVPRQSPQTSFWEMKERLGMGGFGHVYLYQHSDNGEKIAVKICRLDLNAKNKDRWSREIQIMKRLSHVNVVEAREVPKELLSIAINDLPVLAMEYCSRGDLRKVLNKPENCCGLKESEILSLLKDIGAGIQYLHENKIIHRDLKPENIVLQDSNGKFIHKIIDLGYAKDLDQGSLCTSFVGTLQYLAPELFESKPYTLTVDYWSFGTVIFECICGFRPFLHHMQPVQWISKVKNKGPKDIMAIEDMNGEVRFSAHLPYPNNLSRPLLEPIESLLQILLLWDPAVRGGETDENTDKPFCFSILQNILDMKIIHVLDMTSAQLHSLVLSPEESLNSLELRLEAQTQAHVPPLNQELRLEAQTQAHISPLNQELLLETGISLDPRRPPAQCLPEDLHGWDKCIVFLFDKSLTKYSGPLTARTLPDSVNFIVRETKTQLPLAALRKVWGEAVSYICGLKEDYLRLYQGQRAAMLSLLRYNTNLTRYKNLLFSRSQQLRAKLAFFKTSIQHDLELYTRQQQNGISSEKMLKTWQESDEKADNFTKVADVGYLDEEILGLHLEIVELQRSPFARRQEDVMKQLEEKAIDLYKQLKAKCKSPDPPHGYSDSSEMVRTILQTVQNQDRVLKDLYTHLSTILVFKRRIVDLFPKLERALENIATADAAVMQMQMKRQREFWYLLKIACAQTGSPPQSLQDKPSNNVTVGQLLDENQHYLSQLTSLLQDATQETETSVMDQDWSWTQYDTMKTQLQNL